MDGRLLQKQPGDGDGFAGRGSPECEEVNPEIVRRRMKIALHPIPQKSGLIWVQNPSSYVAMSRKVPPQAVTSRRRGGNRGVRHLVTNFSDRGAGERLRRMRTAWRGPLKDGTTRVNADAA